MSSLSAAIIGMLLVQPFQATSWGFALSVVATGAIVTGGPYLSAWCARFLPRLLALPLAVSLSAQLACAPLMLVMRGKLQVYPYPRIS
ncbi:Competence protein [Mobiluncus curtisii]|uniref:Competence protein n=2 Tax=Mobiluncus curtisii TaxID=2051 RepID=A0A2X3BB38_9ACTO|nr:Competence protein [Mobiluncus curtisii]